MSDINNSESKSIVDETWKPIASENKYGEFIKSFFLDKDEDSQVRFLNEINVNSSISQNNKDLLQSFLNENQKEFSWININELNVFKIRKILFPDFQKIKSKRNIIKNSILAKFPKLGSVYNSKILVKIDTLNLTNLNDLSLYEEKRDIFLKEIFWEDNEILLSEKTWLLWNRDDFIDKLKTSSQNKDKIRLLDEKHNWKISEILLELDSKHSNLNFWDTYFSAISDLIKFNFFDKDIKKQLILEYLPNVNLKELKDFSIVSWAEIEKYKTDYIKNNFSQDYIDDIGFDYIKTNLKNDLVILNTVDILNDSNLDKIITNFSYILWTNIWNSQKNLKNELIKKSEKYWPQTLEILKKKLEENSKNLKIKDIEKFSNGNFVEIIIKDEKWNTKNTFLKVKDFDDDKKILKFFEVWSNNIISFSSNTEKEIDYFDFLNLSLKKNINIVFHSENDLKDKVKTWEITTNELFSYSKEDLNNDENRKNYSKKFIESKQKELDKLKKLQSEWKLTNLDREKMNSIEKIVNSWDFSDEQLLDFLNFETLLSKLDDIDPDWKDLKLWKWVLLQAKDWWIHEILGVSDWEILVKTLWQNVVFSYDEFYETFSRLKTKRVKKIKDFWELLSDFEKKSDKWKWFSFENDKLSIKKENKKNPNKKVEYLISDKNDDIVKIHEISWDKVTVSFWERKQKWSLDKKDKNYKDKSEEEILFIKWAKKVTYNLNQFKSQILDDEKYWFRPSWETWKTLENNEVNSNNKFKSWFFTKLFDKSSFLDLISGSKMLLNSIEDTLKRWNDLKAARFALSMWWFLPEELRAELQIKVEREEAESMDKALDWLSKVDSWIAVERIKWWLENKNTPEYKKEAGLMFMLSKYGHLTAKKALYEFRWKYIWYEAFWWKVWDQLYLDVKKECEESKITFSEEYLMHVLLKRQCWGKWFNWVKRRSRLHKEFEWKWGWGIKDELEKWHSDATKKRYASDMVKWWMEEATGWTTSNAIWWFKKAVERWWSIEDMSEWFFCLLYSWACYDLDQKTYLNIRDLWGSSGMPIIMTKFFSSVWEMNLFNDTILELSKEIWKAYPDKFPGIEEEAKEIYNYAKNKKWSEKERLLKTQKFWKKYGTPLSRSINMLHTDKWDYSKTDKVLFLKKDENPILWAMYSKIREISWEWWTFKDDFMWDSCWAEWLSGLDVYRIVIKYLAKNTWWGFVSKDIWPIMWQKITEDLKSTNSKVFSDDKKEDLKLKKKYLLQTLREVVWWIVELHWGNEPVLLAFNNLTTETWIDFRNWWLNISDFKEFSPSRILKWDSDDKLMNAVDNILWWRDEFAKSSNKIESVFDTIKSSIDTHLK